MPGAYRNVPGGRESRHQNTGSDRTLLKCRDVPDHATDYLEGTLARPTRIGMRLHLMICLMCRTYMDQMRKTRALLRRQQLPGPEAETEERLVRAMSDQPR